MGISWLWRAPQVNPLNNKARTIPLLNPINVYGRVFHVSWFAFFIAFWAWYAFPPLLGLTIARHIGASKAAQQNSNIVGVTGTLLVRLVSGPLCDRFGPRYVFAGILLAGAIPTFLAAAVNNAAGLIALRFFLGLIGGSFVPCQVWSTGFFDKNIVGTANSLTAGLGNAGGGVTYFLMPAIFDSLTKERHLSSNVAWRVTFVVPGIILIATATLILLACPDTPTGSWADRHLAAGSTIDAAGGSAGVVDVNGALTDRRAAQHSSSNNSMHSNEKDIKEFGGSGSGSGGKTADQEAQHHVADVAIETARGEVVQAPSMAEAAKVLLSAPTVAVAMCYFCTFGTELAVNGILGNYYYTNFKPLGQTGSGNWAAMFGLLNVVFRPLGGVASDFLYRRLGGASFASGAANNSMSALWARKMWMHFLSIVMGAFLLAIGLTNPHRRSEMFGLFAGLAFFLEAANGANFSLVPHVHPYANGIVSGTTGAFGNLGGIIFSIVFRYVGTATSAEYAKSFWVIGIMVIAINLLTCWIRPIPKGQVGGH